MRSKTVKNFLQNSPRRSLKFKNGKWMITEKQGNGLVAVLHSSSTMLGLEVSINAE